MNNNIELKDKISVEEYKAWITGLLRGKGNHLPDLNDWKIIKKMTDKIVPDVVEVQNPYIAPVPYVAPVYNPQPMWENQPTCGQIIADWLIADNTTTSGTSKHLISTAPTTDLSNIAKIMGFKK